MNGASLELSDTESAEGIEVSRPLVLSLPDHALGTDGARPSLPSRPRPCGDDVVEECYLVDPASSHMLVSKIKPCMCKYELIQTVKLRMAH